MNLSRSALLAVAGALLAAAPTSAAAPSPAWQPAATVSSPSSSNSTPAVAVNARGDAAAVWARKSGGKTFVSAARRFAGKAWAPLQQPGGEIVGEPLIEIADSGVSTVVWVAPGSPKSLWASTTDENGASATVKVAIVASAPALAMNGHGDAVVAWITQGVLGPVVQAAVQPAGGSWSDPQSLSPIVAPGVAADVDVDIDSHGNALVAWRRSGIVSAAVRPAAGDWGDEKVLSSVKESAQPPRAALDDEGRATVVWESTSKTYGYNVIDGVEGASTGVFGGPKPIAAEGTSSSPSLDVDGGGHAALSFIRDNGGHSVVQAATRAAPGADWSQPASLSDGAKNADASRIALDGSGDALVVWDQAAVIGNLPYASELRAGGTGWSPPHALAAPASASTAPKLAFDGGGDAVAAFARGSAIQTADYDAAPSLAGVQAPGSAVAGEVLTFAASAADLWSPVAIAWDFGDGAKAGGGQATHAYAAAGDYTATVTATDAVGNVASETHSVHVTAPPSGAGPDVPDTPQTPGAPFPGLEIKRQTIVVRHRVAFVRASCPATTSGSCTGTLRLVRGRKAIGHAHFRVAPGKHVRIRVHVARLGSVRAAARALDGAGAKRTTRARLRLVSPHGSARHGRSQRHA